MGVTTPTERTETCAGFVERAVAFFAACGVRVEAVMTDEAMNYTRSVAFSDVPAAHGIRHQTTGPYRPRINRKLVARSGRRPLLLVHGTVSVPYQLLDGLVTLRLEWHHACAE